MTYTLYGSRRSGSLIVELALAEIAVSYDVVDIDLNVEAQRDPAYAAVNPQRKIPALITPDGETLTESVAILLTLDERHPDAHLLPPVASAPRAQALRVLLFLATEIYPLVEVYDYPERFSVDVDSAPAVRDIASALWRERWLLLEGFINGQPFLLPWGFCAVDMYIAVVSRWAHQDDWRPAHTPKVENLTHAVAHRPASASVWSRHEPDVRPARFT